MSKLLLIISLFIFSSCDKEKYEKNNVVQKKRTIINSEIVKPQFVYADKDIPLSPHLNLSSSDSLNFDSESGTISTNIYNSRKNWVEFYDFYKKTLPQMGWALIEDSSDKNKHILKLKRKKEKLEIEFCEYKKRTVVKFFLEISVK